ncbi:MAG: hypothetical protein LBP61_08265 [Desulfovibrio sp.]|jgi:hypothetical protein|nr:hypothetical protein [Desulfovibrio sp.]
MLAGEILKRARDDLQDAEGVRFTTEMLLEWLSDAQRALVLLRPDAGAVIRTVRLSRGSTLQSLPADGVRFLGVLRNMEPGEGETFLPGRAVALTTLEALNAGVPLWHSQGESRVVYEYAPDETTPSHFWVSPPPAENVWVEIKYALNPPELTGEDREITVFATFAEPLREYVLYRAYSRNDQPIDYQGRANLHLQRFFTSIGEEAKARLYSSPLNGLGGAGGAA